MSLSLRTIAKSALHKVFVLGQRCGMDILPRHFYSEIPCIRTLAREQSWRLPFSMTGVNGADLASQLSKLNEICTEDVRRELAGPGIQDAAAAMNGAAGFGTVEADCLYAFVRTRRPKQIFQIGCGVSTAVCLLAARAAGYSPEIICVEPFPTEFLRTQAAVGAITLLQTPAQELDLAFIERLGSDLLFFVDSTHTLGPAGEVTRIILEMLPRMQPNADVHFHDIRFPYDYDRRLLRKALFFQHESPLLHAFLCGNDRFEIQFCLSMLHYAAPEELKACFPRYTPAPNRDGLEAGPGHFPSSIYLRVRGAG
jgi:hypothetical protein